MCVGEGSRRGVGCVRGVDLIGLRDGEEIQRRHADADGGESVRRGTLQEGMDEGRSIVVDGIRSAEC